MSFWNNIRHYVDPVSAIIDATSGHTGTPSVGLGTANTTPGTVPGQTIDPTVDQGGTPLTPQQLNAMYGNSVVRLPSSHPQDFTTQGFPAKPLSTDQSNLYNALMDYYRNTPEAVHDAETEMAQLGGTYSNSPQFQQGLDAQSKAAVEARAKILEQEANKYYGSASGIDRAAGPLTRDVAHQQLIQLATQYGPAGQLMQGIPTTYDYGPASATGFKGYAGTDYATQLQSALAAYAQLHGRDAAAVATLGTTPQGQKGSLSALDSLQRYELQKQTNELRRKLGMPESAPGTIG